MTHLQLEEHRQGRLSASFAPTSHYGQRLVGAGDYRRAAGSEGLRDMSWHWHNSGGGRSRGRSSEYCWRLVHTSCLLMSFDFSFSASGWMQGCRDGWMDGCRDYRYFLVCVLWSVCVTVVVSGVVTLKLHWNIKTRKYLIALIKMCMCNSQCDPEFVKKTADGTLHCIHLVCNEDITKDIRIMRVAYIKKKSNWQNGFKCSILDFLIFYYLFIYFPDKWF